MQFIKDVYVSGSRFINAVYNVRAGNHDILDGGTIEPLSYTLTEKEEGELAAVNVSFHNMVQLEYNARVTQYSNFEISGLLNANLREGVEDIALYVLPDLDGIAITLYTADDGSKPSFRTATFENIFGVCAKYEDGTIENLADGLVWTRAYPVVVSEGTSYSDVVSIDAVSNTWMYGLQSKFTSNVKIFNTFLGAYNYMNTGDDSDELGHDGGEEVPAEDRIKTLFYNSTVYSRLYNDSVVNRVGPSSINIQIQYKTNEGEVLINPNRAICGYVNTDNEPNNTTYFGNIHWLVKQGVKIIETNTNRISGASHTYDATMPSWAESTGFYGPYVDGNTIYESKYNTNMYIFANRADAEAYLAGQDPKPIGGGSGGFNPDGFIGDETSYNIQTNDVTNDMSSCWILSKAQLNELALIFSTGVNYVADDAGEQLGAVIESSMRSFIAHGEPVDMVCDLFYLPIDPTEFANASAGQIEIARDQMSLLGTAQEIQDEFGNNYSVKKSIGLDIALGPAASAAYTLGEIKDAVSSVIGSGETSNKFNVRNTNMQ